MKKIKKSAMRIEIEHADSERRKRSGVEMVENINSSIFKELEFSDYVGFRRDTSYQPNHQTTENTNLLSSTTSENPTACSQPNNFLSMLMDVLSSTSMESVITWLPEGNAFIVLNEEEFAKYVLPVFFELLKFESFVKKLYRWGFKSVNLGSKNKVFYHEYFLRDYPNLCTKVSPCNDNSNEMLSSEMNWQAKIMQSSLRNYQRRRSTSMISTTSNITNNNAQINTTCADTLIKNFLDRKMNQIRSQFLLQNPSYTRKFKRHSIGF